MCGSLSNSKSQRGADHKIAADSLLHPGATQWAGQVFLLADPRIWRLSRRRELRKPVPSEEKPAQTSAITRRSASVSVSSGRVRAGPSLQARQIGSLPRGTVVAIVGESGEWLSIEVPSRQLVGWMHSSTLSTDIPSTLSPRPPAATSAPQQTRSRPAVTRPPTQQSEPAKLREEQREPAPRRSAATMTARLSDSAVREQIIRQSILAYPGTCACPYSTDRAGRRCGARSAYSKPGGRSPICYPDDVTAGMIADFRSAAR